MTKKPRSKKTAAQRRLGKKKAGYVRRAAKKAAARELAEAEGGEARRRDLAQDIEEFRKSVTPEEKKVEGLYSSATEALQKLSSEYEYWSGKLTETSLHMCYALIASNWVVFGSMNGILRSGRAKFSLVMVLLGLAANIIGAWLLSVCIRNRVAYGEGDNRRWTEEFNQFIGTESSWPFTETIDGIGRWMRAIKAIFTLAGGALLIIGAMVK